MKMQIICIVGILFLLLSTIRCDYLANSLSAGGYFIYITGDSGRSVDISYLQKEPSTGSKRSNVIFDTTVILPYFANISTIQYISDDVPDEFLTVNSDNDYTTRAIIFTDDLLLADEKGKDSVLFDATGHAIVDTLCLVFDMFNKEELEGQDDWERQTNCHCITEDSVLNYLKSIDYPCYMEFTGEETEMSVYLYDYWGYERE